MIDIKELLKTYQNKRKKALFFVFLLSIVLFISILLFIFLSNYKVQWQLALIGSIVNSLIVICLLCIIFFFALPYKHFEMFLVILNNSSSKKIKGKISEISEKTMTIKKGVKAYIVKIEKAEYFLAFEDLFDSLPLNKNINLIVKDAFIVGVKQDD